MAIYLNVVIPAKAGISLSIYPGCGDRDSACAGMTRARVCMKQFVLVAYDAKDEGALGRRMAAREEHLKAIAELRAKAI